MKANVFKHKSSSPERTVQRRTSAGAAMAPPAYGFSFIDDQPVQRQENKTGMPDTLKSGIESLSGMDMSDVKVNYNSSKPAQLNAHAYAQGSQIHIGPGQEKHLPHEAWHVVQQKQGRVQATMQAKGIFINDDSSMEREADVKGTEALSVDGGSSEVVNVPSSSNVVQRVAFEKENIFNDQLRWAVAKIIADKPANEQEEALLKKLDIKVEKFNGKNQTDIFKEGKKRLKGVTYKNLLDKGLVMDAIDILTGTSAIWTIYKTKINNDTGELDNNIDSDIDKELQSKITWGPLDNQQGTSVTALILSPDHLLGSPPDRKTEAAKRAKQLTESTNKKYVAGHLLNSNLGGPGNSDRNLTAIPSDVNSREETTIESKAKKRVNNDHKIIFYGVTVDYEDDNTFGRYACQLNIKFGTYKKDTLFNTVTEKNYGLYLQDIQTHSLSIHSPFSLKRESKDEPDKKGYKKQPKPALKPEASLEPDARFEFDPYKNIVLKEEEQIRLHFIAYAISELKINELDDKIFKLIKENADLDQQNLQLKEKLKAFTKLEGEFVNIKKGYETAQKKNSDLQEEIETQSIEMAKQKSTLIYLEGIVEEYKSEAKLYQSTSRDRAEELGYLFGIRDGENGIEARSDRISKDKRLSNVSENRFQLGYNDGYSVGLGTKGEKSKEEKKLHQKLAHKDQVILIKDLKIARLKAQIEELKRFQTSQTLGTKTSTTFSTAHVDIDGKLEEEYETVQDPQHFEQASEKSTEPSVEIATSDFDDPSKEEKKIKQVSPDSNSPQVDRGADPTYIMEQLEKSISTFRPFHNKQYEEIKNTLVEVIKGLSGSKPNKLQALQIAVKLGIVDLATARKIYRKGLDYPFGDVQDTYNRFFVRKK